MTSSLRCVLFASVVVLLGGCGPAIISEADSGVGGGTGGGSGGGSGGGGGSGDDAGGTGTDAGNGGTDAGNGSIDAGGGTIDAGYGVTVSRQGNGSGKVAGTGLDCGADCSELVINDGSLFVTATAEPGTIFNGWGGSQCFGFDPCNVGVVNGPVTVSATFTLEQWLVNLTRPNPLWGTITGSGPGLCSVQFKYGDVVTIEATPRTGYSTACRSDQT